ncbi:MAG: transporter [Myxococcota bacterium]
MLRVLTVVWLAGASLASAQAHEDFSSDRPGYANGTQSAPHLRPIVELGAALTVDEDDAETLSAPGLVFRFGLGEYVELRASVPGVTGVFQRGPNDVVVGDVGFGFKVAWDLSEAASMSFIPSAFVSLEDGPATGRLEWNWSVGAGMVGFAGNLAGQAQGGVVQGEGSVAVSLALGARASVYVQSFLIWPEDVDPLPFVGAGVAIQVAPRIQVDTSLDVGLTDDTTRLTIGAGLSLLVGQS